MAEESEEKSKPVPEAEEQSLEEWFAQIDAMRADPLFPEGRKQNVAPIRKYFE